MGQYYKPINLDTFEWLLSHDYNSVGLKLMEHSYIGNGFVGVIMKLLTKGNNWYKGRIVWVGDYSEKVLKENSLYDVCYDEEEENEEIKLFKKINPKSCMKEGLQKKAIIVNYTKKEYVKLSDCKEDKEGWAINPLPLLTALGNGGGGGDYTGSNMDLIGRWAFDEIGVEFDEKKLIGYTKITPDFKEGKEMGNNQDNEVEAYNQIKEWLNSDGIKKRLLIGSL